MPGLESGFRRRLRAEGMLRGSQWHPHAEDRAMGRRVVTAANVPTRALQDVTREPEAKACAGGAFGGEERFEQTCLSLPGYPLAIICDGNSYSRLTAHRMTTRNRAQTNMTAFGHGVNGVRNQVDQNLAEFSTETVSVRP